MARFLKDEDYSVQAREEIMTLLDDSDDQRKLLLAEKMAQSQMSKRLAKRYDLTVLFAPAPDTGDDLRDPFIIMTLIDLTLYHLWTSEAPGRINATRKERYQDALDWLKDEGTGTGGGGDMPEKDLEDYANDVRLISRKPENQKW